MARNAAGYDAPSQYPEFRFFRIAKRAASDKRAFAVNHLPDVGQPGMDLRAAGLGSAYDQHGMRCLADVIDPGAAFGLRRRFFDLRPQGGSGHDGYAETIGC